MKIKPLKPRSLVLKKARVTNYDFQLGQEIIDFGLYSVVTKPQLPRSSLVEEYKVTKVRQHLTLFT